MNAKASLLIAGGLAKPRPVARPYDGPTVLKAVPRPENQEGKMRAIVLWMAGECAARWCCSVDDVLGRGRSARVGRARRELYADLHGSGLSLTEIAKLVDRDHTTVLAGIRAELVGVK